MYVINKRMLLWIHLLVLFFIFAVCVAVSNSGKHGMDVTDCVNSLVFVAEGEIKEEIKCFYHELDDIWYLFLPSYAELRKTEVSFSGADYISCQNGEEAYRFKNGQTIEALQIDKVYKCSFLRGEECVQQLTLQVMQSARLPTVFIETETGSMELVEADKTYKEPGTFALFSEDGRIEWLDDLDHITGRGNDTWGKAKKSFGIKLSGPTDLLGMGAARHWILLSNVVDDIYIRNKITYDMAVAAGMGGAPESRYIDLYINHIYHGMYQLSEKVEIGPERIAIDGLDRENEKVDKDYKTAEKFGDDAAKGICLNGTPRDITGGYLIERDVYDKYVAETSGFQSTTSGEYYTIKSPEYASEAEVYYIRELFSEMEEAVRNDNGINPTTQKSYLEYIDLKSFVQKYIIEEFSKNNGGGATSSFFYKPVDTVSSKIFSGPVWDYDKAYGTVKGYSANIRDLGYLTLRAEGTTLFEELYQHEEFRNKVVECWREFFSEYMEEVYVNKIDNYFAEIEASAKLDRIRWEQFCYGCYDWEAENKSRLKYLKKFIAERKAFLDEVWLGNATICKVTFEEKTMCRRHTSLGVIKGETLVPITPEEMGYMPEGVYLEGWYDVDTGELFDASEPVERDIMLQGKLTGVEEP